MFNIVSDKQFEVIRQRWHEWLAIGLEGADPRIVDSLKKFNQLPNVCSTWSCSGHTREEYEAKDEMKFYKERQKRNIVFVINKDGGWILNALEVFIAKMDRDDWALVRPEIRTFLLSWAFGDLQSITSLYPTWQVVFYYNNLDDQPEVSKIIHEGMEQVWGEMIDFLVKYHKDFVK